jgi:DNA invertase Pin-like site-specific DNA recombinase
MRAAMYTRVSTDKQDTENQKAVLRQVAERRGWEIVSDYEDAGISGSKGRDKRPAFDRALKDASRRRYDVLLVWSMDRLGRSVLHVANAMAELDAAGVALYTDKESVDATTPHGKAMLQMAVVFAELERSMIRQRVIAGLDRVRKEGRSLGRPKIGREHNLIERKARKAQRDKAESMLRSGNSLNSVMRETGLGSNLVQKLSKLIRAENKGE